MKRFSAIWKWTGVAWVDLTDNTNTNTDFSFISAATDVFYFGYERRPIGIYADLTTNGSYTGLSYQYYTGIAWKSLPLIDSYSFDQSKYIRWQFPSDFGSRAFSSTFPYSGTPPDSDVRFWVRISASAVTTTAVINKIRCIPFTEYSTAQNVSQFLITKKDFDGSTKPSDFAVEKLIRRAEDRIDFRTHKSWRFNAVTDNIDDKNVDSNRYGFYLRHKNFTKVYSVKIWDGGQYQTLTEGRTADYIVDYDPGMIYLTRGFTLPAVYGLSGRFAQYDFGEFKKSIMVDYVYGRNSETDPEFYVVEDLATKMAAVDVLRHADFSILTVSGTDKVALESKIANLENEIEDRISEITGIVLF